MYVYNLCMNGKDLIKCTCNYLFYVISKKSKKYGPFYHNYVLFNSKKISKIIVVRINIYHVENITFYFHTILDNIIHNKVTKSHKCLPQSLTLIVAYIVKL